MKVARVRQMSKLEGDLKSDGYKLDAKIISLALSGEDNLIITVKLKKGDIKRITDYWSCVRVLSR